MKAALAIAIGFTRRAGALASSRVTRRGVSLTTSRRRFPIGRTWLAAAGGLIFGFTFGAIFIVPIANALARAF